MDIKYGRKRSGIKRELNQKIEDWLSTIDDESVQKVAREDVIVTGGSIASMLLGEKVNDFDVYFRSLETTEKVATYYVNKFNLAHPAPEVEEGVTPPVPAVMVDDITNIKGETEKRVIIYIKSAGVASENQGKYEYFEMSSDSGAGQEFSDSLKPDDEEEDETNGKYHVTFMSQNAITLSHKVQLVTRFYGEPDEIHDNYDFIHAMCYWDHAKSQLELPADALEALLSRTLVYKGSLYPIASVFRTKKFLERGWRISAGQQLKMMWQISELNLRDFETLREQLTGVDAAYLHQLIKALEGVDPEKINSAYVSTLIDKIFD